MALLGEASYDMDELPVERPVTSCGPSRTSVLPSDPRSKICISFHKRFT